MWVILQLTAGQLVRQRRTLLLVLLAILPPLIALLFRVTGGSHEDNPDFAAGILGHFVVGLVLPLTALVVGTAALGQELEDGTVVYLITKPLARWRVVLAKLIGAWLVTTVVVGASVAITGALLFAGADEEEVSLVPGFLVAVTLGALAYTAVFVSLSIRFTRALIIGLAYVFVWEGLVSQFISGVRFLSVRAYTVTIAKSVADSSSELLDTSLDVTPALILLALLTLFATWYAIRRLNRYEMSERL
jgi:ABC-2 type transport system permease protein